MKGDYRNAPLEQPTEHLSNSASYVRPTLVDMSLQRSVSGTSRLVSGEVLDVQAERSTPSSSPTIERRPS